MVTYLKPEDILARKETAKPWARTATGYGRKLPTAYMVQLTDKKWRRVYVCCYSNSGTAYVLKGNEWLVVGCEVEDIISDRN